MGKTTISRNIPYPHFWPVGGKFSLGVAFVICTDLLVPFYLDSILTLCINPWRSDNSLRGAPAPAGADAEISPAIPSMSFYPSSGREEAIFLIRSMSRNKLADISTYCTTLYDVSRALQQRSCYLSIEANITKVPVRTLQYVPQRSVGPIRKQQRNFHRLRRYAPHSSYRGLCLG